MIKVRVGQIWTSEGETEVKIESYNKKTGNVYYIHPLFSHVLAAHIGNFFISYSFVPQNNLEWLSVKVSDWSRSMRGKGFMARGGCNTVIYSDADNGVDCPQERYTLSQWQNMRYHLGLDKKPHYEFINGQWSETK